MKLKEYQEKAVAELLNRSKNLLSQSGGKKMVFKSPTGSGKTIMMAAFLAKLADTKLSRSLSFIWVAPKSLHQQSRDKLERYYEDSRALECAYFTDLTDKQIGENEILFLNWESIRQEDKNVIVRENEFDFYLEKVLENTKYAERDIVLIIDESHHHATSENSQQLIGDIAPKLVMEVSATPVMEYSNDTFSVSLEEVKNEGMIKKSVIINDGFSNTLTGDKMDRMTPAFIGRTENFVLTQALAKRQQLATAFSAAGIAVNPLLCIQLPDRRTEQDDNIRRDSITTLADNGITVDNGKLAIWLADEKENWRNIAQNDNAAEVMIFKQAIALGWDCPRAQILVLFRNWRSLVFSVQTLGRIMRMPEPETGHYANDILNSGYVYTNMPNVEIQEDVAGGYLHIYYARRKDDYAPVKLTSVHRLRQREQTRLSPRFDTLFLQAAKEYKLAEKIKTKNQTVQKQFIADYRAGSVDEVAGTTIDGSVAINATDEEDLQKLFDYFARDNLSPFYPDDRSIARVKTAIYAFFDETLKMNLASDFRKIIKITLSEKNRRHFITVLGKAKDTYAAETKERKEPLQETKPWEVPEFSSFGDTYAERAAAKSVLQPFFAANNELCPEKEFIKFLENSDKVKWWYKNGEKESHYFAVPYVKNGEQHPFYVDFIVQLADGRIGLYDPKLGRTIDEAKNKSDGLLDYIRKANRTRKEQTLTGGIVTPANSVNYSQGWRIYAGKGDELNHADISNWGWLEI